MPEEVLGALLRWHGCQSAPNVHPGSCYGLGQLWMLLLNTEQTAWLSMLSSCCMDPPTHPPPITLPPAHPSYTQHS